MSKQPESKTTPRKACCSVGYGGEYEIHNSILAAGYKHPHHITWLPKGYATTADDYVIALIACPPDEDWSEYGLGSKRPLPPLIAAICKTIEEYMEAKNAKA